MGNELINLLDFRRSKRSISYAFPSFDGEPRTIVNLPRYIFLASPCSGMISPFPSSGINLKPPLLVESIIAVYSPFVKSVESFDLMVISAGFLR